MAALRIQTDCIATMGMVLLQLYPGRKALQLKAGDTLPVLPTLIWMDGRMYMWQMILYRTISATSTIKTALLLITSAITSNIPAGMPWALMRWTSTMTAI